jgi:hypothetical protein
MNVLKDPGGPLFWPFAVIAGGAAGGILFPLVALVVYWGVWRIRGQR